MPKVKGSVSTVSPTATHRYHGFAGVHVRPDLLAKYVDMDIEKEGNEIVVTIENRTEHVLFSHPLRQGELRVGIERDGKRFELEPVRFFTKIGHNGKAAMPWRATEIVAANRLEAKRKKTFRFKAELQANDQVTAVLGYYIVNPAAAEKLGLKEDKYRKFHKLKSKRKTFP
jgi:hypothetical protein